MRPLRSILCFLAFGLSGLAPQISAQAAPSTHRIVIAAGTVASIRLYSCSRCSRCPAGQAIFNLAIRLFVLFNDNHVNPVVRQYFCGD